MGEKGECRFRPPAEDNIPHTPDQPSHESSYLLCLSNKCYVVLVRDLAFDSVAVYAAQTKHLRKIEIIRWLDKARKTDTSFTSPTHCNSCPTLFDFDPTSNGWKGPRFFSIDSKRGALTPVKLPTTPKNMLLWR